MTVLRALVVDDEYDIRHLVARALRDEGIHSDMAADGAEAAHKCATSDYDVVLTDLRMPNMHGHALATTLLARERRPLVIVLSAAPEPALVTDMLRRGVDDYVMKPVNFKLLAAKVRALLNRHNPTASSPIATSAEAFGMTCCKGRSENEILLETIEQQLSEAACKVTREVVESLTMDRDVSELPNGLRELAELLNNKADGQNKGSSDRRTAHVIMPVLAVAIDEATLRPVGWPFKIVTYQLARNRIRFVHPTPLQNHTLALRWPLCTMEGEVYLIVQVAGCQRRRSFFDLRGHLMVH